MRQVLKGIGQIMLQNNALTGLLFVVGIAYSSITMAIGTLVATSSATFTAKLFKLNEANLKDGLYGFSAALVGVAFLLFFQPHWLIWLLVILAGSLAALMQHFFIQRNAPVFTLPFILITWVAVWCIGSFAPNLLAPSSAPLITNFDSFAFAFTGFGQVILQGSWVAGAIFFIAVFLNSSLAALYALVASLITGLSALALGVDAVSVSFGLLSFNAVLTALVFAGPRPIDALWVVATVVLTLGLSIFMLANNLMQLTFPFVLASMLGVLIKRYHAAR